MAEGEPPGSRVQPPGEGVSGAQRPAFAGELEEGGLADILGRVNVGQYPAAGPEDGTGVSPNDPLERFLVTGFAVATQQLGIIRSGRATGHKLVEVTESEGICHLVISPASRFRCHIQEEAAAAQTDM